MIRNILALFLLLASVYLAFRHGWDTLHYKKHPGSIKMMTEPGITEAMIPFLGALTLAIGVLLLIPKTFFLGNLLNAISILVIMALALNAGNYKMALIEIPFLAMPLLLIGLKYPFINH